MDERPVNRGKHIHPTYVALNEVTLYVNWCVVALCTQNVCRDSISFTWHQPCNNQTALQLHHFGGYLKRAIKGYNYSLKIECVKSAETARQQRIALYKSNESIIWRGTVALKLGDGHQKLRKV